MATRGQRHQLAVGLVSELRERSVPLVTSHRADFTTNCFKHHILKRTPGIGRKGRIISRKLE